MKVTVGTRQVFDEKTVEAIRKAVRKARWHNIDLILLTILIPIAVTAYSEVLGVFLENFGVHLGLLRFPGSLFVFAFAVLACVGYTLSHWETCDASEWFVRLRCEAIGNAARQQFEWYRNEVKRVFSSPTDK